MFDAWGDESGSVAHRDPDVYLMGAVIADPRHTADLREAMRSLLLPNEKKVHWRGDSPARHDAVIDVITELPLEAVAVVRMSAPGERDERRRRKCFERFATTLAELGCTNLTLESRGRSDDRRDMDMLAAMRASKQLDSALRLGHATGPSDSALWIADAVCGAVVADRIGEPRWLKRIAHVTTVHTVDDRPYK